MEKYIIINNTNNPLVYAKTISRELYKISKPVNSENDKTKYLFGWVKHKDKNRYALKVDLEYEIYIHPTKDVSKLVQMLSDDVPESKLLALASQMENTDRIKFKDILPDEYSTHTYNQMVSYGWFENITTE